jgi:hypothetical protein
MDYVIFRELMKLKVVSQLFWTFKQRQITGNFFNNEP